LSQWSQQGAYDSAAECEVSQQNSLSIEHSIYAKSSEAYVNAVGAATDPVVLKAQRYLVETHNAAVSAFMASRCIAGDDPRLK